MASPTERSNQTALLNRSEDCNETVIGRYTHRWRDARLERTATCPVLQHPHHIKDEHCHHDVAADAVPSDELCMTFNLRVTSTKMLAECCDRGDRRDRPHVPDRHHERS